MSLTHPSAHITFFSENIYVLPFEQISIIQHCVVIVTILCIRASDLIHLITESLCPFVNLSLLSLPIFQEIQKIYYQWKKQIKCFLFYFSTLYSLFDYALMITVTIYWAPTVCQTLDVHNINQLQYFCKVGIYSWGNWGLEKMSVVLTLKFRIKDHLMIKRKKRDKKN